MEVQGQRAYNADVDTLFKTFGSAEFIHSRLAALGARNVEIKRCEQTADSMVLEVHREVPVDAPALLKKFLGDWNPVVQIETWTGTPGQEYHCKLELQIKGAPVQISGDIRIFKQGDGAVDAVKLNVECKIPLVGGKLADFVGRSSAAEMQKEFDYLEHYLKG